MAHRLAQSINMEAERIVLKTKCMNKYNQKQEFWTLLVPVNFCCMRLYLFNVACDLCIYFSSILKLVSLSLSIWSACIQQKASSRNSKFLVSLFLVVCWGRGGLFFLFILLCFCVCWYVGCCFKWCKHLSVFDGIVFIHIQMSLLLFHSRNDLWLLAPFYVFIFKSGVSTCCIH